MSQVKNLRAMFENKGDEPTPPDRGRSPGAPWQGSTPSESPRPLSKVRTNFVAIEKDGRMALQRSDSHNSSPTRTRPGTGMDNASTSNAPLEDLGSTPRKLFTSDAQPEAISAALSSLSLDGAGEAPDTSSQLHQKQMEEETPSSRLPQQDSVKKSPARNTKPKPQASATVGKPKASEDATASGSAKKISTSRSANLSTKPATGGPLRSAANAKTSTTATKTTESRQAAKPQEKPAVRKPAAPGARTLPATKQTGIVPSRKPPPVKTGHAHDTGFVKPKVKSPTKPVSLPASLMAPTASSVSKGSASRQSLSRQSGNLQPPSAVGRAPSRASVSTAGTSTAKTVKRKPSTINSSRPSFGPPPKQIPQDQAEGKRSSQVDEGFLARMMRPTQSSSSKTNEKTATPPRRIAARPSTSTDASSRRASSSKRQAKGVSPAPEQRTFLAVEDSSAISTDPAPEVTEAAPIERSVTPPAVSEEAASTTEHPVLDGGAVVGEQDHSPKEEEPASDTPAVEIIESEKGPQLSEEAVVNAAQVETAEEVLDLDGDAGSSGTLENSEDAEPEVTPASEPQGAITEEECRQEKETQPTELPDEEDKPKPSVPESSQDLTTEPHTETRAAFVSTTSEASGHEPDEASVTEDLAPADDKPEDEESSLLSSSAQPSEALPRDAPVAVGNDEKS